MTEGVWLWLAFVLMAMTTIGTRGSFILLGEKGRLPPALQRALRYAPAAALSALVMPDLLIDAGEVSPLNPKFAAGLVVLGVALRWRNPWLPFIIGMGVLLALRKGMGW
jgi:branched-subunit amino acid transport protein